MRGGDDTEHKPGDGRDHEGKQRKFEGARKAIPEFLSDWLLSANGFQIASDKILNEMDVLHGERVVEPQLLSDTVYFFGGGARFPHHHPHRIAGGEMDHHKDDDRDDEEDGHHRDEAPKRISNDHCRARPLRRTT